MINNAPLTFIIKPIISLYKYLFGEPVLCLDEANRQINVGDYIWVPPPDINDSHHFGFWEGNVIKINKDKKCIVISDKDGNFYTILARKTRLTYSRKNH